MRTFLCVVLAVAAVSASITTIGQSDSFLGNENPLLSFLHTAEPPRAVIGTGFERAMSADEQFANTFGSATLDGNSVFSKETVLGMVKDPQLLESMGYGDREVFNGTELNAIADFLQRSSTSARGGPYESVVDNYLAHHDTNSEHGTKMCYCHYLGGHSTDDVEELDTDNPNLYIALFLGANKNDVGYSYNPGHDFNEFDYRICALGEEVATSTVCAETCIAALSEGNINGKFWLTGCPVTGIAKLTTAAVASVDTTHYHLHAHVREIEEMKMFAVLTRSTDEKRFCSEFSKRETLKAKSEAVTQMKKGSLLEDSCESRVQRFMELANGDMYYVNSHVTALNACEQDGACNQEIGLRGMWPRLTGESCSACMARSYTAALDYEILERNNVETSSKSFCQLQRKIHPYLEEPLQDNECASIVQSFQSTRDATQTALQSCSNVCDYAAPLTRTVDDQKTNRVPLSQMDSSFWEEIKAIY